MSSSSSSRTVLWSVPGLAAGWVFLVFTTKPHEMLVGAAAVLASALLLWRVLQEQTLPVKFRWRDVLQMWRIPGYIAQGCATISWLLLKDLAGQRVGSFYRSAGFRTSTRDPEAIGRTVLATIYTTVSPNFIVIGVDASRSLLLFHQIERSDVLAMTKALGAQEGQP